MNGSSVGPCNGVQSFRNRLLQHGSPTGAQVLLANLLQHGLSLSMSPQVLPGACSSASSAWGHSLLWTSTCSGKGSSTGFIKWLRKIKTKIRVNSCLPTYCSYLSSSYYQIELLLSLDRNWKIWALVHFPVLTSASVGRPLFGLLLAWLALLLDEWLALYFSPRCKAVPRVAGTWGLEVRTSRLSPSLEGVLALTELL